MCYYKLLKENSNGKSCKCYIKLAKRSEKREANDNFNKEKGFVEYIYINIVRNRQHSDIWKSAAITLRTVNTEGRHLKCSYHSHAYKLIISAQEMNLSITENSSMKTSVQCTFAFKEQMKYWMYDRSDRE